MPDELTNGSLFVSGLKLAVSRSGSEEPATSSAWSDSAHEKWQSECQFRVDERATATLTAFVHYSCSRSTAAVRDKTPAGPQIVCQIDIRGRRSHRAIILITHFA